jgi:hypothetical protein
LGSLLVAICYIFFALPLDFLNTLYYIVGVIKIHFYKGTKMAPTMKPTIIAYNICNTPEVVDSYPEIYQMAYNILYYGKITKKQQKRLNNLQSEDVRKLGYVPSDILTPLKGILQ